MPRHSETRRLPYTADQMYDVVADVESYPEFIPWTAAARIRSREPFDGGEVLDADLVVSFKVFRERFTSRATLWDDKSRIDTEYIEGPFRHMNATWRFRDLDEGGSEVSFAVDFEIKNRILGGVISRFFSDAMQRIVKAFEGRAHRLYGGRKAGGPAA